MSVFQLSNKAIFVEIDSCSGCCVRIENPEDPWKMNWIDSPSCWGNADGFIHLKTLEENGRIISYRVNESEKLEMQVIRCLENGNYTEEYLITNHHDLDFFLTHDNFGLYFSYNNVLIPRKGLIHDCCISKIWCGGANSWLCSSKADGSMPHLICMLAEGALADYSTSVDASRIKNASHYRGFFILHPEDTVIGSGETLKLKFIYGFRNARPDFQLIPDLGQKVFPQSDRSTIILGETAHCSAETPFPAKDVEIRCNGQKIAFRQENCRIAWELTPEKLGEQLVQILINGESSLMRLNVIESIDTIMTRRVQFIIRKQQFHKKDSHLDGAYLIYDRKTDRCFCSNSFDDNNSGRERLGMAVLAACELRRKPTPELQESLKQFRAYLERELFDVNTKTVFNFPNRDNRWHRFYNYPWFADFYFEYYLATGDTQCLKNAADIMLKFYELSKDFPQESPGDMPYQIIRALEKTGETELFTAVKRAFLRRADKVLDDGTNVNMTETSVTGDSFGGKSLLFSKAYLLTGDTKYLEKIQAFFDSCLAFTNFQMDYHCWGQDTHYWDLYWFGKMKAYGDTMPQWTCSITGSEMFFLLGKIRKNQDMMRKGKMILMNGMCLFDRTGFASASYLYPYRVHVHYPENIPENPNIPAGTWYGKCADDWTNDQDWMLYQLARFLRWEFVTGSGAY